MERPINHIERARRLVVETRKKLWKIKDIDHREKTIDLLNCVILLCGSYESFLNQRYKLQAVEGLLISRLYSLFYDSLVNDNQICIERVIRKITDDICYPQHKKQEMINFLLAESAVKSLEQGQKVTPESEWQQMLDTLLTELKRQMTWSL